MSIIHIPDFSRLKAARDVLAHRARICGATPGQRTRATSVLYREMQRGRSAAFALSLALRQLRPNPGHHLG